MKTQQEIYHDMFIYSDKSPSCLLWNIRPSYQFATVLGQKVFNHQFALKPAGSKTPNTGRVKGKHYYWYISKPRAFTRKFCPDFSAHRIIYIMFNGDIPAGMEIDHRDNNTLNNCITNLRLVTKNQNQQNARAHQIFHLKGAYPQKTGGWTSFITKDKHRRYLGFFATEQLAHQAYCEASKRLHQEFSRTA